MQASPNMQRVITALAFKHGINLWKVEATFRLDMPHFDRLVVENIGGHRISVAHYFVQNGDLVADPEVVFLVRDDQWYPVEMTQVLLGWRELAQCAANGAVLGIRPQAQAAAAEFADWWADQIEAQGWLEHGALYQYRPRAA